MLTDKQAIELCKQNAEAMRAIHIRYGIQMAANVSARMVRQGHDTQKIAHTLGVPEATVWNLLARRHPSRSVAPKTAHAEQGGATA